MFTTSGDLRADRRLSLGLQLKAQGELESAISLIEQALELAPRWEAARFALAETLEAAGRCEEAKEHYVAQLRDDLGDTRGASLRLAMLGAAPTPAKAPEAYVKSLFDDYAPRFEESLVRRLGYDAPAVLRERLDAIRPAPPQSERILDLGCGTGLAGAALRSRAAWLEGVDLSPAMVAQARRKGIYDALTVAEIENHLAAAERRFDLVVATDVLIYFGSLEGVMGGVRRVLAPGGLAAFTVQVADTDGFLLGIDERYSHGHGYLVRCAAGAGLAMREASPFVLRQEAGHGVAGLLCFCSDEPPLSLERTTPAAWSPSPAPSFR